MPDETTGALNNDAVASPTMSADSSGELIGTVESVPAGTPAAEGAKPELSDEEKAKAAEEAEAKKFDERFDRHPRFQELRQENQSYKEHIANLEGKMEALLAGGGVQPGGEEDGGGEAPDYVDITTLSNEQVLDWQAENPIEFQANLAHQLRSELRNDVMEVLQDFLGQQQHQTSEQERENTVIATIDKFANDHPDFDELWDAGILQQVMQENPGHNAMSAYFIATKGQGEKQVQERIDQAIKERDSKLIHNQRIKQGASVLSSGPGTGGRVDTDADLKNTKTQGGLIRALVNRSNMRDRARYG